MSLEKVIEDKKSDLLMKIDKQKLPKHVAIIMDGNGRWATRKGLPRSFGHKQGVSVLKKILKVAKNLGCKVITVYAFSTENWTRPKKEVDFLINLFSEVLKNEIKEIHEESTKIKFIGDLTPFPKNLKEIISSSESLTKKNNKFLFNVCVNYGGRQEIVKVAKELALKSSAGEIKPSEINEELFNSELLTGRAGRSGEAILFVNQREKHFLRNLENSTRTKIEEINIPSNKIINEKRMEKLIDNINESSLAKDENEENKALIIDVLDNLKEKYSMDYSNIAMAAINLVIGNKSFFINDDDSWINKQNNTDRNRSNRNSNNRMRNSNRRNNYQNDSFETYKFNFGKFDGVRVANIISSICNSTNINGRSIGKIQIFNDYSLVDLPRDLHRETKNKLKKIKVRN